MADEKLGLDANDFIGEMQRVLALLSEFNLATEDVTKATVNFSKSGNLLGATVQSITASGETLVANLKNTKDGLELVGSSVVQTTKAIDTLGKLQIGEIIRTTTLNNLRIAPDLLSQTAVSVDNLAKSIQASNEAGRALEVPRALEIIQSFAENGRAGLESLTSQERKFVDTLSAVSNQLDIVTGKLRTQALEAQRAQIGQAASQFANVTAAPAGLSGASATEVATFNKALNDLQKIAESSGLTLDQVKKVISDVGSGASVSAANLQPLVSAFLKVQEAAAGLNSQAISTARFAEAAKAVDQFRTSLGSIPSGATAAEINRVNLAFSNLTNAVAKSGLSTQQAGNIIGDVSRGIVRNLDGVENKVQASAVAVTKATGQIASRIESDAQRSAAQLQSLGSEFQRFINRFTALATNQIIFGFFRELKANVRDSQDFSLALGEITTLTQSAGKSTEDFSKAIIDVSNSTGLVRKDVAEGLYQTLSNQIGNAAQSVQFLSSASRLAIVGQSTLTDSVNLLSAALNSFGLNVNETERVSAILFKTVDLGRLRISDLANTFGTVGVIAHQAGATIEEVGAALAVLTINGVTAANAQTFLRNIFAQTVKPTKEMKELIRGLGFESGDQAIKVLGFAGFVKEVEKASRGAIPQLAELFTNIRSLQGIIPLTAGPEFEQTLLQFRTAQEDFSKAFGKVSETTGFQFRKITNEIENNLKVLSDAGIKTFVDLVKGFGGVEAAIGKVTEALVILGSALVAIKIGSLISSLSAVATVAPTVATVTTSIGTLATSFTAASSGATLFGSSVLGLAAPFLTMPILIGVIAAAIGVLIGRIAAFRIEQALVEQRAIASIEASHNAIIAGEARFGAELQKQFEDNAKVIEQTFGKALQPIAKEFLKLEDTIIGSLNITGKAIKSGLEAIESEAKKFINHLENLNAKSIATIQKIRDEQFKSDLKFSEEVFTQSISNLGLQEQAEARIARAKDFANQAAQVSIDLEKNLAALKEKNLSVDETNIIVERARKQEDELLKIATDQFKEVERLRKEQLKLGEEFSKKEQEISKKAFENVLGDLQERGKALDEFFDRLGKSLEEKAQGPLTKTTKAFLNNVGNLFKSIGGTGRTRGGLGKFFEIQPLEFEKFSSIADFVNAAGSREQQIRFTGAIDPDVREVLELVNPKFRKRLELNIRAGRTDEVKKQLEQLQAVVKARQEAERVGLLLQRSDQLRENAKVAGAQGSFEEQRRLLQEAATLAQQAQSTQLRNKDSIRARTKTIDDEQLASITAQGALSKKNQDEINARLGEEKVFRERLVEILDAQVSREEQLVATRTESANKAKAELQVFQDNVAELEKLTKTIKPGNTVAELTSLSEKIKAASEKARASAPTTSIGDLAAVNALLNPLTDKYLKYLDALIATRKGTEEIAASEQKLSDVHKAQKQVLDEIIKKQKELGDANKASALEQEKVRVNLEEAEARLKRAQAGGRVAFIDREGIKQATQDIGKFKDQLRLLKVGDVERNTRSEQLSVLSQIIAAKGDVTATFNKLTKDNPDALVSIGVSSLADLQNLFDSFRSVASEVDKSRKNFTQLFSLLGEVLNASGGDVTKFSKTIDQVFAKDKTEKADVFKLLGIENEEGLRAKLVDFAKTLGIDLQDLNANTFDNLLNNQTALFQKFKNAALGDENKIKIADLIDTSGLSNILQNLNLGEALFKDETDLKIKVDDLKTSLKNIQISFDLTQPTDAIQALIDKISAPIRLNIIDPRTNAPVGGFAAGGLVGGKFNSTGKDNVLAALRTGEFVVNPSSTREFFNELVSINRGIAPAQGSNTNNSLSLGGININLQASGSNQNDAREIAKELRRLVKRGVVSLS